MKSSLDYRDGHLCILDESELGTSSSGGAQGCMREWHAVREAAEAEVATLVGRPVTRVEAEEGLYVDEDGNPYQLAQFGKGQPLAVKITPLRRGGNRVGSRSADAESCVQGSTPGTRAHGLSAGPKSADSDRVGPKALLRKQRRKRQAAPGEDSNGRLFGVGMPAELPEQTAGDETGPEKEPGKMPEPSRTPLNLRQKLAEVRRRIGYVQKRGHNERFNYSYVTAADIAGTVGDILAELGVVVIPRLEDISYESAAGRGEATRMARVVMAYTFSDVDSGEEVVAKVAGQGIDPGDKAPYKAMTGALKYALLQSFLLATGDDPEDERPDARSTAAHAERPISGDEVRELQSLIDETGTDLERVLAYYKVASLSELTETAHRRAVEILNRKLAKRSEQGTAHAQD